MSNKSPVIFIASPVRHSNPDIIPTRIEEAARFAAWVKEVEGKNPYPAAVVDYHINRFISTPKSDNWWSINLEPYMSAAEACYVLCLEGWEKSTGTKVEIDGATRLGKPVYYYQPVANGYQRH